MKKKWIVLLMVLLALAGAAFGGYWYFDTTYLVMNGEIYRRDLQQLDLRESSLPELETVTQLKNLKTLDLRGTAVTVEQYEQLREALPECEILWVVPFQDKWYDQADTKLTISSITREEMGTLVYLEGLETIDATACTDLDAVMELKQMYPQVAVHYLVPLAGEQYPETTQTLTLADADIQALADALDYLPQVTDVTFTGTAPENEAIYTLKQAYPNITFHWDFELLGLAVNSDITEIDLSGIKMDSVETIENSLQYFNCLEKVIMCDTGLASEEIDALWKRHPETRFVWNVKIGRFWIRTDATTLMPFQHGYNGDKGIKLYDKDCKELKYLVDMVCMDFGHMGITDLSFLEYMPNLEYLIIADASITDITPMQHLKKLKYLEAFLNNIRDISPLLGCTSLEDVNLSNNPIQDITPLGQIESLNNIWISGRSWPQEQKDALNAAKPDAKIVYYQDVGSTSKGWRSLENYFNQRDLLGMWYMTDDGDPFFERPKK